MTLTIAIGSPLEPDLDLLFQRHSVEMQADTPPESVHMLPREALTGPQITFFVTRDQGVPVAMGALKQLDRSEGELKSMHVLAEHRGRGLSRMLLRHLLAYGRDRGLQRLSLETGVQPGFVAARTLYSREGFTECPPFGSYRADPNSVFMTMSL